MLEGCFLTILDVIEKTRFVFKKGEQSNVWYIGRK